jgi:transcriptional regulator with XRE-family HTH domain
MPKPISLSGKKNLISQTLIEIRKQKGLSQRALARDLQLAGYDIDKNVITRIETGKRYVTDIELAALCKVLHVHMDVLIEKDIEI